MKNETLIPSMSLRYVEIECPYKDSKYLLQQRFTRPGSEKPIWIDVPIVSEDCL